MTTKVTRDVLDAAIRPITSVDIDGGSIDGTTIGASVATTGRFTTLNATSITVTTSVNFTGASTSGIAAYYADLAEYYKADEVYEPGTVVKIGGVNEITKTNVDGDLDVFGVISTSPAMILNTNDDADSLMLPVALLGRVPCFVVGPVEKGQRLYATADGASTSRPISDLPFARSLVTDLRTERRLVEVAIITVK